MRSGELLGGRFRIEALAEIGGMGAVYRAFDVTTGRRVAAKVLHDPSPQHLARFAREAELLARLEHPGIVRHVAYNAARESTPFLAMEWLEGEDLSRLLSRRRLTVTEAVELGARVAAALGAAHAQGVVHRDLKPANLFLVGGQIAEPKLLDFGIARLPDMVPITAAGVLVGTPEYMAPEQARSGDEVGAPADIFSLGCLLFECLTGAPPFQADHLIALLARIIFDEPPRLSERCPGAPLWLDALVSQMLEKDPARRPRDGAAAYAALATQEVQGGWISGPTSSALTSSERRFHGVAVVGRAPASALDATLSVSDVGADAGALREVAARFEGRLELLADGTAVLIVGRPHVPTDVAAQLARCALALRERVPDRPIAITVGWGELGCGLPVGDAIQRAAGLLRGEGRAGAPQILVDKTTAGLLEARFEAAITASGALELRGERGAAEPWRPLLGRPTRCVGRDHELRVLEQTFAACAGEPAARAVLVIGGAGMGKSRLLQEHLAALRRAVAPAEIWAGRGDPLRAGSIGGLLAEAIRGAAGITGGEPIEERRALLRARVARRVPEAERRRIEEFLGELVGVPFLDDDSLPLRAARQDPELLGEQMQRALRDFLRAECAVQPVVLALEDVHWADRASVAAIDTVLRELADQPLVVLATARPEIKQAHPDLWAERGRQELCLRQLSPRACAQLAREALGDAALGDGALIDRLVAQSEGQPFFLEELIRATAEGRGDALPETVVAMVQVRLEALPPPARRILRAASVLGEVFWRGAVAHLLGGGEAALLADHLAALVTGELCVRRRESRFPGEEEYSFRQALLREGAYAQLTEEDRALGHRLAADWLEAAGEADPLVLAAHCERGGLTARAASLLVRGAELAAARRAYLDAEGCYGRAEALLGALLPAARHARGLARFRLGRHAEALADLAAARDDAAAVSEPGAEIELLLDEAMILDWTGEYRAASSRVAAAERLADWVASPLIGARLLLGMGRSLHRVDREEEAAEVLSRAAAQAAQLGDEGHETHIIARLMLGFILASLGRVDEAARDLDAVILSCEERSDLMHLGAALNNRGLVRALQGDRAGMIADFERTIALGHDLGQPALGLVGRYNLAEYLYLMDDLEAATPHARAVHAIASRCGDGHASIAVALLAARLRLYQGDEAGARGIALRLRAAREEAGREAMKPSEDVLCAMIELATRDDDRAAWAALEERSARCSVGQERIEVLEARALSALRRGRHAEARAQLERALAAASTIPTVMGGRLRRWHAALTKPTDTDAPDTHPAADEAPFTCATTQER
ncbi:serine/threonine-protein kinase [Sorangium sp. So ce1000]|uniref:serine/threonine-protein kinase n=1 Tax=Sorangium sp. So ce1000 TaxID=3133325 RepID=UPI003F5FE660